MPVSHLLLGLVFHRESGTPFHSQPTAGRYLWGRARCALYAGHRLTRADVTPPGGKQPARASIAKAVPERMVIDELMTFRGHKGLTEETVASDEARRAGGHSALHETYYKKGSGDQ